MRFERESWRKLYVGESIQHRLLPVLCRGLRDYVLRHASDDGTLLSKTTSPGRDLAMALGSHPDEFELVARFVETWLEDGYLTHRRGRLFVTRYVEAQQARSPGAERQAKYREKKSVTSNVTRDATVTLPGDAHVTSQLDETRRDETRTDERAPKPPADGSAAAPLSAPRKSRKPPKKPETHWPENFDAEIRPRVLAWARAKAYPDWWTNERLDLMRDKCRERQHTASDWFLKATVWLSNDDKTYGNGPTVLEAKRARQPGQQAPGLQDYESRAREARMREVERRTAMLGGGGVIPVVKLQEVPK
jgi:hypothetical protein